MIIVHGSSTPCILDVEHLDIESGIRNSNTKTSEKQCETSFFKAFVTNVDVRDSYWKLIFRRIFSHERGNRN